MKRIFEAIYNFIKNIFNFLKVNFKKIAITLAVIILNIWFLQSPFWKPFTELEIVKTNLVAFLVVAAILALIARSLNLSKIMQNCVEKVKETIDASKEACENSIKELDETSKKVANVQSEIKEIIDAGDKNIYNQEQKIALQSQEQIEEIRENAVKTINTKEKEIISKLSKNTIAASIELAKEHIINLLKNNPEYHKHFIKESIKELDRLN